MNSTKRICIAAVSVLMLMICPMLTVASSSAETGACEYAGSGHGDGMSVTYLEKTGDEYATLKVTFETVQDEDIYLTMDASKYAPIPAAELSGGMLDIYVKKVSHGAHILRAECGDFSGSVSFTVKAYVPVASLSLNKDAAQVYVGGSAELRTIITPDNATLTDAVWTSSNTSVATVDDGTVTGIKEGNAVITATVDGKTADCLVTVVSVVEIEIVDHGDGSKTITETNRSTGTVKVTDTKDTVETDGSVKTVSSSETKDRNGNIISSEKSTALSKDGTVTVSSKTTDASGNTVIGTVSMVATELTVKNGVVVASASSSSVDEAVSQINKIKDTYGAGNKTVSISIDTSSDSAVAEFASGSLGKVASIDGAELRVETSKCSMTFDRDVLSSMSSKTGDVRIGIGIVDKSELSEKQKESAGDRTVYELSFAVGSDTIHELGGNVTVKIPYTLKSGEDASNITVWYLNDAGDAIEVDGAVYDEGTGMAVFTIDHFSKFMVGADTSDDKGVGVDTAVIIGIAAAIVLLAAVITVIIVVMKKKKNGGGDGTVKE